MSRLGITIFTAILCSIAVLSGCDSGGNVVAGIDRGGLRGVYGSVSGFGSVIVNGEHYDTDTADVSVNGVPADVADLEVGYVVLIQADLPQADSSSPAKAVTIDFDHIIIGPLATVAVVDNLATVLGQRVTVDDSTAYGAGIDPASIDGLAMLPADTILRISGFAGADGGVLATRIELGEPGADLEVTGIVMNLNLFSRIFEIGGLEVRYDEANLQGFSGGQPQEGNRVSVEGSVDAGGVLVARELELEELELEVDEEDEFEIEGLITEIFSAMEFSVAGIRVSIDNQTDFENGDATMLDLNVRIEAEGQLDNGVLRASEIEFSPEGPLRIKATVDSVNPLKLLGITVESDSLTIFEDKSATPLRTFSLTDIVPADPLDITGYESLTSPGVVIATGIIRKESLKELKIRGIAENVVAPGFSILGVTVITDGDTEIEGNFFTVAEGRLVEVQGSTESGSFVADKVEIKDD
jgi:hypothetical protein